MTAIESIITALKGLVTLEQSQFHELMEAAQAQHDAEQAEIQALRDGMVDLGKRVDAIAPTEPVDLAPLEADLTALTARVSALEDAEAAAEPDADKVAADVTALNAPTTVATAPAPVVAPVPPVTTT